MIPKVIVCVSNDLTTDQRVHKSCTVLMELGYEVLEYGRLLTDSLELKRDYKTHRVKHFFNKGPLFYAEFNIRLFVFLLFNKFELVFSNDLDTLLASILSSKIKRKPIIYDTHEYFTQTPELVKRPFIQGIWKLIEDIIFPFLTNIITVNDSIAALYQNRFKKSIQVIRNIPLTYINQELKNRNDLGLPIHTRIIILQGAGINVQRGAEEAIEAMQYVENAILLIIGNGDVINILKRMVKEKQLENIVIFKPKMPFTDLRQYTMNADLGLAIDKNTNINYQYSLPNKLFDFIHAEIPILASRLVEIEKIIEKYNIGYFIENHNPQHIAERINTIFKNSVEYNIKKKNLPIAKNELCWEKESAKLIEIIQQIK